MDYSGGVYNGSRKHLVVEYMPDMYRTPALEPYSGNSNLRGQYGGPFTCVEGSIAQWIFALWYSRKQTKDTRWPEHCLKNPLANGSEEIIG